MARTVTIAVISSVAIAVAAGIYWFDWNRTKGVVTDAVYERSGRKLEIQGDIDVTLSMTPTITFEGITFANADWASRESMLRIKRLRFSIRLWELLKGRVVLPRLELYQPVLELERQDDNKANWEFDPGIVAEAVVPDERTEFPIIGKLHIENGRIHYVDATRQFDFEGEIASVAGQRSDSEDSVEMSATGALQNRSFELDLVAGSLIDLRDEDQPYPLTLTLQIADTAISVDGTLDQPLQLRGMDLRVTAEGPDLSRLYELTGAVLPGTPPYKVSGQLRHREGHWQVDSLDGRIGDSDIGGDISLDTSGERHLVRADLHSRHLDLDDLAPIINAPPATGPGETVSPEQKLQAKQMKRTGKLIPDETFDLSRLREADAEFRYSAADVSAANVPLQSLEVEVRLHDAAMSIEPLRLGFAKGALQGSVHLDASDEVIEWRYDLSLDSLSMRELANASTSMPNEDLASGTLNGSIAIETHGNSMHDTAVNGEGTIKLRITGGRLSSLLIELVGLDVAESVGLLLSDNEQNIPFRCAVGALSLSDGKVSSEYLIVDTADTRIDAELNADLASETFLLTLDPKPKDMSPLALRAPLHVEGSFREVGIRPDIGSLGLRAGAAIALGTVATPVAALLAFFEPGPGEDANCEQLVRDQSL